MLNTKNYTKLIFLDIETKAIAETFYDLSPKMQNLFANKWSGLIGEIAYQEYNGTKKKEGDLQLSYKKAYEAIFKEKAHPSPEFAEIICISAGMIVETEGKLSFKCASFCGELEKDILTAFLANKASFIYQDKQMANEKYMVTYNGSQFDIPFLSRRILYNGLDLPVMLDVGALKPWDCGFLIDLKTQIKFGGFDAPSLEMLCTTLGVETALDKYKVEASELARKYKTKEYDFIKSYCEYDVFALACCYLKLIRSKEYPTGINQQLTKI